MTATAKTGEDFGLPKVNQTIKTPPYKPAKSEYRDHLGAFAVTADILDSSEFPNLLAHLQFVPLRAEFFYYRNTMEYVGYSPLFDKIPVGEITPQYTIMIECERVKDGDDIFTYRVERVTP